MRGHIRRRSKKSWAVVISLGRDPVTGRPRQKWYSHASKREAEAHLAQILAAMQGGSWTPPSKLRLGDFLENWLRDYAAGAVGPLTLKGYRMVIRRHIIPALGHVPLGMLSPQAIQSYFSRKLQEGLSSTSVHGHYRIVREALGHAVRWGLLARNPALMTNPPRKRRYEARIWDEEQVRLFLAEAKRSSVHYALYLTAVLTGMRQGELLGLRWRDLDLVTGTASVRQTFCRLGREQLFKEPKTETSRRTISLSPTVIQELQRLRDQQDETRRLLGSAYQAHDLVFCQADGKPLHAHNLVMRDFRRVISKAGLPRIRFHDLRHGHASYLALAGVPPKVAQERLGHSTPAFTMRVYTHTLAGQHEAAAKAVEAKLLGLRVPEDGTEKRSVDRS